MTHRDDQGVVVTIIFGERRGGPRFFVSHTNVHEFCKRVGPLAHCKKVLPKSATHRSCVLVLPNIFSAWGLRARDHTIGVHEQPRRRKANAPWVAPSECHFLGNLTLTSSGVDRDHRSFDFDVVQSLGIGVNSLEFSLGAGTSLGNVLLDDPNRERRNDSNFSTP